MKPLNAQQEAGSQCMQLIGGSRATGWPLWRSKGLGPAPIRAPEERIGGQVKGARGWTPGGRRKRPLLCLLPLRSHRSASLLGDLRAQDPFGRCFGAISAVTRPTRPLAPPPPPPLGWLECTPASPDAICISAAGS